MNPINYSGCAKPIGILTGLDFRPRPRVDGRIFVTMKFRRVTKLWIQADESYGEWMRLESITKIIERMRASTVIMHIQSSWSLMFAEAKVGPFFDDPIHAT